MNVRRYFLIASVFALVGLGGLEFGDRLARTGDASLITESQARIGRPLTPVSVAGVARRTVRRCAVGVYDC
ncbi:MAG: hypothetical protein SGJ07_02175 [Rhodospirillaceae bacterium]|nr:hypothetical protein [Rhodospirillaceae bacterium]